MSARLEYTRVTGVLLAVVVAVLAVVAAAVPASAHAELVSSDPEDGTTVQGMPETVTLTFSEQVRTPAFVEVTGPDGDVAGGDPRIVDDQVIQSLEAGAAAGSYEVAYRITSADGHPISGTVGFTLAGAAQERGDDAGGQSAAPPTGEPEAGTTSGSGGMSTGQLVLLLGVLAVGLAAVAVGTRRALRHSVAMVDDKRVGRSGPRR